MELLLAVFSDILLEMTQYNCTSYNKEIESIKSKPFRIEREPEK
jgi:hypothetical protein